MVYFLACSCCCDTSPHIAWLHVTSRRPCWWSRTKAFLSSGNLTLFSCKFFEKKFHCIDPQHGRLVTWLQAKNRDQDTPGLWTPRRGFRIPRTKFQSLSVELGFRIPTVLGFEFLVLFSRFQSPGFRFRIPESGFPFTGKNTADHQWGRDRVICLNLHVLVLTNFMFSILKWWFARATFALTFSTPIYNERKIWFFVCKTKNCWKALSERFHVSRNIKGFHPQTQKLKPPFTVQQTLTKESIAQ